MKVLILGAGYGTRLQRDLETSPEHHHLLGIPKALLPLGGRDALITHWLELFRKHGIDVFVVTNAASYDQFCAWAERHGLALDHIASDGTTTNDNRLGAVPDIAFGIRHFGLDDGAVLVVGGDTLFLRDFRLEDWLKRVTPSTCLITTYTVPDESVHKHGIVEVDPSTGVVTSFLEKPDPAETPSRLACPCFYYFAQESLPLIDAFIESSKGKPKEAFDATGKFLAYLYPRYPVNTYLISGRIDVGGLQSYLEADAYFGSN
ncbi:nucleotide-diphospho-sugar transferase [Dichotomocladium elegans]|nr:nucleotide-diphospho-sugar transferase [Dichotomocladium elegans]